MISAFTRPKPTVLWNLGDAFVQKPQMKIRKNEKWQRGSPQLLDLRPEFRGRATLTFYKCLRKCSSARRDGKLIAALAHARLAVPNLPFQAEQVIVVIHLHHVSFGFDVASEHL